MSSKNIVLSGKSSYYKTSYNKYGGDEKPIDTGKAKYNSPKNTNKDADIDSDEKRSSEYKLLTKSGYKKPESGTKQDKYSIEEIKTKLKNYIPIKTNSEMQILKKLPIFNTWIKYINKTTKKLRTGGLLMKVDLTRGYIMLANPSNNISWSVQLKDNLVFIPEKYKQDLQSYKDSNQSSSSKTSPKQQTSPDTSEEKIKEKLYELYKKGKLRAKKE